MCCEIDCMRWLMLHPSAAAVWMKTFRLCLKRQFKGFRGVTIFISFVSRITFLWSPRMDVFGFFSPLICHTLMTGESMETMLVVLGKEEGGWFDFPTACRIEAQHRHQHTDRKDWRGNCKPRVCSDRLTVLVCVHSSWLQEQNICLLVKMNRTASCCRHHFPRKVLLSHLPIAWRLILIFFFYPKTKAHSSRRAVSLIFSFRDNAELLLSTSGYDGVILHWSTGAKEIKVCCGNLHAKHPGVFPLPRRKYNSKLHCFRIMCSSCSCKLHFSYEILFSF